MTQRPDLSMFSKEEIKETLNEIRHPVSIALFGSENEFNIGGCIRASHNFLIKEIHFIDVKWFYKKGAMSTLSYEKDNIVKWDSTEAFLSNVDKERIVAFERRVGLESKDIRDFVYPKNPILFFGSEKSGVPDAVLDSVNNIVSIPMDGLNNDHNVTVTCGIALYDWYFKFTRNNIFNVGAK